MNLNQNRKMKSSNWTTNLMDSTIGKVNHVQRQHMGVGSVVENRLNPNV